MSTEKHSKVRSKRKSKNQAASALMGRKLLVIDIKPINVTSLSFIETKLMGVKTNDLVNFTRQLATMINAGLPLASALAILQEQSKPAMTAVVSKLLKDVESGKSFAGALQQHPDIFSRVYIQLVKAGEAGGVLDDVLERLALMMENKRFSFKNNWRHDLSGNCAVGDGGCGFYYDGLCHAADDFDVC